MLDPRDRRGPGGLLIGPAATALHRGRSGLAVAAAALVLLLVAGCGGPPPAPGGGVVPAAAPPAVPPSYEASLLVRLQREGSVTRSAEARWLAAGSSFLLSARYGPLIPLLSLAAGPDSVYLLLPRRNEFAAAASDARPGDERDLTFGTAAAWLRGILEPSALKDRMDRVRSHDVGDARVHRGLADGPSGRFVAEVWEDVSTGRIRRWTMDGSDGRRLLVVEYPPGAWKAGFLPREAALFWPEERFAAHIRVQKEKAVASPSAHVFRLERPGQAREVDLGLPLDALFE